MVFRLPLNTYNCHFGGENFTRDKLQGKLCGTVNFLSSPDCDPRGQHQPYSRESWDTLSGILQMEISSQNGIYGIPREGSQ